MRVVDWFNGREGGAVLVDAAEGRFVRAFAALPLTGSTGRAVRRFFPDARELGTSGIVRLGGWRTFSEMLHDLVEARVTSTSQHLRSLHLIEGSDGVGMRTIPASLLR